MNLPADKPLKEGLRLRELDFKKLVSGLMQEGFTGYIVLMAQGIQGIEEGILLLKNGLPIGCHHELMKLNYSFYGDKAVNAFLNASTAKGIIDVFSLALQQVDLVLSFNEQIALSTAGQAEFKKKIEELPLKEFSKAFVEEALASMPEKEKVTKAELIKKFGFEGIQD